MKIKIVAACLFILANLTVANAQESASAILETASAQAKKENKNVFVMFHASWCSWCKKMDNNMKSDACNTMFDNNYVVAHIVVQESSKNKSLENPGGDVVLKKFKGENAGLPFWVILDPKGNLLADPNNAKGENLGCPATPEEVAVFTEKLKKTSKLSDKQLVVITETFTIKK
jgi:thioredoxin-related protein